jgi:predicted GH43/DUF377 family glycosyl hydrolase
MKWLKLGQVFKTAEHLLPPGCIGWAQSPQTLVLPDRVRVFFSTRARDATGKYLSHVTFADFERDFSRVISVSQRPVIELGSLGCFDEHGIFPLHVLDDGDRVLGYSTGWNRKVSVSADASIGLAISHDHGQSFQKHGRGPVMTASLTEPFLVADAFVMKRNGEYHMWYIYGTRWKKFSPNEAPDRVYKIAYARSEDGIAWHRNGRLIVADRLDEDECQALPTVIEIGGRFHMYFCYRHAYGFRTDSTRAYRIGYAFSDDMQNWTRDDAAAGIDVSLDGWDSKMQCYPHVFKVDDRVYMLYNGNDFGREGFGLARLEQE